MPPSARDPRARRHAAARLRPSPLAAVRLRHWPLAERPRERLLSLGAAALSDAELLAVLFGTGRAGCDALELAHGLLAHAGSLRSLLLRETRPRRRDARASGLGAARRARLAACLEIARRHYAEPLRSMDALESPAATQRYLLALLRDRPYEVFCCLFLDTRHRLIACEELFRGTLDGASVHPREVVREALERQAAAVILAHNHPSGVAEPSQADELITHRLREALGLVEVRLLDHVIVGAGGCLSLAERGLL
jgi:DNA repair protein RadC